MSIDKTRFSVLCMPPRENPEIDITHFSNCVHHRTASLRVRQSRKRIYRQRSYSLSGLPRAYKSHRWNDQSSLGATPLVPVLVNLHVICHVEGTELLRGVFDLAAHPAPSDPAVPLSTFRKPTLPSHAPRMRQGGGVAKSNFIICTLRRSRITRNAKICPSLLQIRCKIFLQESLNFYTKCFYSYNFAIKKEIYIYSL